MDSYYEEQFKAGLQFQDHVMETFYKAGLPLLFFSSREKQLHGENMAGVEVKFDKRFKETRNLYIETAEKSNAANARYVPSGICKKDNSWLWVQGDYDTLFVFAKKQLVWLWKRKKYREVETGTSLGFLLPEDEARPWAINIL